MKKFDLLFTDTAAEDLEKIRSDKTHNKRLKAVHKALGYLQLNPRHPSLNTHKYSSIISQNGEEVFEAYAENHTPGAYRIFWHYGKEKGQITILAIIPHP